MTRLPRVLCVVGLLIALGGFVWSLTQYAVSPQVLLSLNDAVMRQQRPGGLGQGIENLAGEPRVAIFQHPPGRLEWTLALPRGRHRFSVGLGVKEEAWAGSDGVTFRSSVMEQGKTRTLLDTTVVPRARGKHRGWVSVHTEFSTIGREIVLVFETGAGPADNDIYDWALWSEPQIETLASPLQWSLVVPGSDSRGCWLASGTDTTSTAAAPGNLDASALGPAGEHQSWLRGGRAGPASLSFGPADVGIA